MIATIKDKRTIQLGESIVITLLGHADTRCLEIAGISPCLVPGRFPEEFVGLLQLPLIFQCKGQIENSLTIVRIRIAFLPDFHSLAQIELSLVKTATAQIPQTSLIQTAHIIGVATQSLLIIVEGTPGSVTVLLQVQPREIKLVVGLCILWRQGRFGCIGDGTYIIWFCLPEQVIDRELQILQQHIGTCHRLLKDRLW